MKKIFIIFAFTVLLTGCSLGSQSENINQPPKTTGSCKDNCGDGICQDITVLGIGYPCRETPESCPQDCNQPGVIFGKVTLGPTCPVMKDPPDPGCADKPYQTTIQIIDRNSPAGAPYKVVSSDSQGNYTVTLPAGEYNFQPAGGQVMPRCSTQEVTVKAGDNLIINFSCDTGIR